MVLYSMGVPPAALMPAFVALALDVHPELRPIGTDQQIAAREFQLLGHDVMTFIFCFPSSSRPRSNP